MVGQVGWISVPIDRDLDEDHEPMSLIVDLVLNYAEGTDTVLLEGPPQRVEGASTVVYRFPALKEDA